jgi:hypothetical protein
MHQCRVRGAVGSGRHQAVTTLKKQQKSAPGSSDSWIAKRHPHVLPRRKQRGPAFYNAAAHGDR